MKAPVCLSFLVAVGLCFGIITVAFAVKESTRPASMLLVAISGTDSNIRKPAYARVTSAEVWQRVWARHLGTSVDDFYRPIMDIDFDRCLVIVVFRGEQRQVRQITIDSVSEAADSITIRFAEHHYGIERVGRAPAAPAAERPYAFIVLPKTEKEIVVEEKIWSKEDQVFDRPARLKQLVRLSPTQIVSSKRLK